MDGDNFLRNSARGLLAFSLGVAGCEASPERMNEATRGGGDLSLPGDDDGAASTSGGSVTTGLSLSGAAELTGLGGNEVGDPLPTADCADVTASIEKNVASIMLLLDGSRSMDAQFGMTASGMNVSRWQAMNLALFDPATSILADLQAETKFGMTLYTSNGGGAVPAMCPILQQVPADYDNFDAMLNAFPDQPIGPDTPTGEALIAVAEEFGAVNDGTTKAIVVATDGQPDTCAVPNGDPAVLNLETLMRAQTVYSEYRMPIFVIAVVTDAATPTPDDQLLLNHLQQLANVGQGRDVTAAPEDQALLYTASEPAALAEAFQSIITGFVPCDFTIDGEVTVDQACRGTVLLDGTELECGTDWEVTDASTLALRGTACAALQDGEEHDVKATFPCEIIDIK